MKLQTEIREVMEYDVVVLGGGPAGCAAAAAAARDGAKTLLVEAGGMLGGMGTLGLVPAWTPFSDGKKIIYRGIAQRVFEETKRETPSVPADAMDWVPINVEALKRVYDNLVQESGVEVLFHTVFSHVVVNTAGDQVEWVILSNKEGLAAYSAKVFIDTTGDGDLCAFAGVPYEKGGEQGELQPGSHCFVLSNVDMLQLLHGERLHSSNPNSPVHKIALDEQFNLIQDSHMCDCLTGPGVVSFNAGHIWGLDNTDVKSVARAEMIGREMAHQFQMGLGKYHRAFANAHLAATASHVGIRETRRILGDYYLTVQDYLERKSFVDEIARNCYYIDVHNTQEEIQGMRDGSFDPNNRFERYKPGESHGIPFRCLIPQKLENVLMAGRCISTDRVVQGSTRVMPVCLVMGEAAGAAAAQCVRRGQAPRQIDVQELRATLRGYGNYLPE